MASIFVAGSGPADLDIVFNGLVAGQTGFDAIQMFTLLGSAAPYSTVNGCIPANPGACLPTAIPGVTHKEILYRYLCGTDVLFGLWNIRLSFS